VVGTWAWGNFQVRRSPGLVLENRRPSAGHRISRELRVSEDVTVQCRQAGCCQGPEAVVTGKNSEVCSSPSTTVRLRRCSSCAEPACKARNCSRCVSTVRVGFQALRASLNMLNSASSASAAIQRHSNQEGFLGWRSRHGLNRAISLCMSKRTASSPQNHYQIAAAPQSPRPRICGSFPFSSANFISPIPQPAGRVLRRTDFGFMQLAYLTLS